MVNIKIRIGIAAVMAILVAGCVPPVSVVYVPDPNAPIPGWKCPSDRQFIAHTNPPCTWIPGGVLTESCRDEYTRHINEARGCVPEPDAAAAQSGSASAQPQGELGGSR
jgi:hypothetical protein